MTTIPLPIPGEKYGYDQDTVIASCWLNDTPEDGPMQFALLLLTSTPGSYYRVVIVEDGALIWAKAHENIIPATEDYSEQIGGY